MSKILERLDNLRNLIQNPDFMEGKGLSNEVNIRIFCYDPKEEMAVRYFIEKLTTDPTLKCHLIEWRNPFQNVWQCSCVFSYINDINQDWIE